MPPQDPHAQQLILTAGPPLDAADGVLILVHGRGASARSMLELPEEIGAERFAVLAPQAERYTWYPNSFLAPLESNQPCLDSALRKLEGIVNELLAGGLASDRIALLGFSQGACLTSEFVARHPRRYGAVMVLTGGLIGPPGTPREYAGSLEQTPVFLGSGDPDPHVPFERVEETRDVFERMGAVVDMRRYPGMPHTIGQDELDACRKLLSNIH
jgi:predicted esterase